MQILCISYLKINVILYKYNAEKGNVMENSLLYAFLFFITFGVVFWGISTVKWDSVCRKNGYADMMDRGKNIYDEKMAVTLAEAYFEPSEKWVRGDIIYNYPTNEWLVIFTLDVDNSEWDRMIIGVRRDNGSMTYYE